MFIFVVFYKLSSVIIAYMLWDEQYYQWPSWAPIGSHSNPTWTLMGSPAREWSYLLTALVL